jgi:hypothetical protein
LEFELGEAREAAVLAIALSVSPAGGG